MVGTTNKRMAFTSLGLCLLGAALSPVQAATYWIDSGIGVDTNDGLSQGTPFLTIQKAANTAVAGDTINICPGKGYVGTTGTPLVEISTSGSAGSPIIYQGCPGQPRPVLNGTKAAASFQLDLPVSYITIQGLEIAGWSQTLSLSGAWVAASSASLTATYNGGGIASQNLAQYNGTTNNTTAIGNSTLHFASTPGSWAAGLALYDVTHPTAIPAGSVITGAPGTSTTMSVSAASPGISSGDVIQAQPVSTNIVIQNNIIHDFPEDCINTVSADYVTISYNLVYNCSWYAADGPSAVNVYGSRDADATTGYKTNLIGNVLYNNKSLIANNHQASATFVTSGATATTTVGFTTNPATAGVVNTMQVFDRTHPTVIVPGTYVTAVTSSTITMSSAPTGGGISSGDTIVLGGITDGEGIIIDDNKNDQVGTQAYVGRTLIQDNLGVNNGNPAFQVSNSSHVDVAYNTGYLNQYQPQPNSSYYEGEILTLNTADVNVYNNITYSYPGYPGGVLTTGTTTTWANNLAFGGTGVLPGSGNINSNPQFVSPSITLPQIFASYATNGRPPLTQFFEGFQLTPGSAAIDAASISFTRTIDILGNPGLVGPSYDLGAFESPCSAYGASTISNPSTLIGSQFQDGQAAGSITALRMRNLIATLACGRSPWAH